VPLVVFNLTEIETEVLNSDEGMTLPYVCAIQC
jgi:hypothetical protein